MSDAFVETLKESLIPLVQDKVAKIKTDRKGKKGHTLIPDLSSLDVCRL